MQFLLKTPVSTAPGKLAALPLPPHFNHPFSGTLSYKTLEDKTVNSDQIVQQSLKVTLTLIDLVKAFDPINCIITELEVDT